MQPLGEKRCSEQNREEEKSQLEHKYKITTRRELYYNHQVFREPKLSSMVEPVLSQYGKHIEVCVSANPLVLINYCI